MSRQRISEYRSKQLIFKELKLPYSGIQVNTNKPLSVSSENKSNFVVKVDQGIKGRYKKGLIRLNVSADQLLQSINELREKGFSQCLIEEMKIYTGNDEKYISIERIRSGYKILYSEKGGINIEQNAEKIKEYTYPYSPNALQIPNLPYEFIKSLINAFDKYCFSFLEINPFIIADYGILILDAAAEVDSTAQFFVEGAWTEIDFTDYVNKKMTEEELNVKKLAAKSQAAFSLNVLNPDGSIFMLLSGGGASIVLADEVSNLGYGAELANYGEYSGNPSAEESYIYTKNIINLLLKSTASKKVLIIAGGVANFTDIRITFKGVIRAINEFKLELNKQKVKIYVRRGGPHQNEGLNNMLEILQKENLLGLVTGPEMVLTDIVSKALSSLK